MAVAAKGVLFEYGLSLPPLALIFDFNPQQISRSRIGDHQDRQRARLPGSATTSLRRSKRRAAAQGVETAGGESISITILLDATDKMQEGDRDRRAIRRAAADRYAALDARAEGAGAGRACRCCRASAGGGARAFERAETASVLVFAWGLQFLPVFLTGVSQNEALHLPNLAPYRAEMTLTMQVIESNNPFFLAEKVRQTAMTALNAVTGF